MAVATHAPSTFLSPVRATEICMAFPALDALREGDEVYPVVDAIAGTSVEAHWRLNSE